MTAESGAGLSGTGETNSTGRKVIVWADVLDNSVNPAKQEIETLP